MNITKELLDIVEDRMTSHPSCMNGHVCQKPTGRICIEVGCNEPAGTLWGPNWCPDHDRERLDRIDGQLQDLKRQIGGEV